MFSLSETSSLIQDESQNVLHCSGPKWFSSPTAHYTDLGQFLKDNPGETSSFRSTDLFLMFFEVQLNDEVASRLRNMLPQTAPLASKLHLTQTSHVGSVPNVWQPIWGWHCLLLEGSVVIWCHQLLDPVIRTHSGPQHTHVYTHAARRHVTIKITSQLTNPSHQIMNVLVNSAIMDLGHLEENLDTLILCSDWIKGQDESYYLILMYFW